MLSLYYGFLFGGFLLFMCVDTIANVSPELLAAIDEADAEEEAERKKKLQAA